MNSFATILQPAARKGPRPYHSQLGIAYEEWTDSRGTIGIAASDFLCIDLSTLASILGLSESLTGVTFLAFGNGSPDVFSTFAAMRSNSGSLAIGELIGAASFITSVVAGSMALVRPFKVARRSFVRDVGYFIVAVSFSMVLLADGHLHAWESAAMVGLYVFYVVMVVGWHWFLVRRRRKYERDLAARTHFHIPDNQELEVGPPVEDDDPGVASESRSLLLGASTDDFDVLERADGMAAWKQDEEEDDETRNRYLAEIRDNMHVRRPPNHSRRNTMNPIRPSLVGALEFQSVLHSLEKARSTSHKPTISLSSYSDDGNNNQPFDTRSIASHPRASRPATDDRLTPSSAASRTRAVSANDAERLKLDTTLLGMRSEQAPRLTVSRPSNEGGKGLALPRIDTDVMLTASPSSSEFPSANLSPVAPQTPNLLAPPGSFNSPNYNTGTTHGRSPAAVSPKGTWNSMQTGPESPAVPFPSYVDEPSGPSSRPPSSRLPNPASLPSEALLFMTVLMILIMTKRHSGILSSGSGHTLYSHLLIRSAARSFPRWQAGMVEPQNSESAEPDPIPSVVIEQPDDEGHNAPPGRKHSPHWDSELPALVPEVSDDSCLPAKDWNRWLVGIQLFTGPFFFVLIAWTAVDEDNDPLNLLLPSLLSLLFSLVCLSFLIISTRHRPWHQRRNLDHDSQTSERPIRFLSTSWRSFLSLLGFLVAISWIATIATEVVSVLKTIGVILNISDSLLGLTVFAVGNSLGDLVADITVARLGYPVMALSACFGGPMLNILLGIGLGGLYMSLNGGKGRGRDEMLSGLAVSAERAAYKITISKVLVISGATLLMVLVGLLIVVPLNHWKMDRTIGYGLIVVWCLSTVGNVIAELTS
ncbi:Sodium/calcium exchanger membrane region [Penicillium chermesinum]|nr:Sodium/calcium exchanger membrane region [Penicillium chermesinum]